MAASLFPYELPTHQLVTVFILGGLCAAALSTMAADPASYFAFITPGRENWHLR